jgi:hypothetical protein
VVKVRAIWAMAGMLPVALAGLVPCASGAHAAAAVPAGIITTVAGGPGRGPARNVAQDPESVAAGPDGTVYAGDQSGAIRAFGATTTWERAIAGDGPGLGVTGNGDGGPADRARLSVVGGLAVDAAGDVIVSDSYGSRVRMVPAVSGTYFGVAMTAGDIYTIAGDNVAGYGGDGGPAVDASLYHPVGLALDAAGNLLIADRYECRIRMVAATSGTFYGRFVTAGEIVTVAGSSTCGRLGDGGPAGAARLSSPGGVAVDRWGNLVIADTDNNKIRVVAASSGTFYGQLMTSGDIYAVAGDEVGGYLGDGGPATSAELHNPGDVSTDAAGNLVIADTGNNRIRVVAASSGTFYGQPMVAGDIYTVAGDGTRGFAGDGRPATSAKIRRPEGVAVDGSGGLVIADTGNGRVRLVAAVSGPLHGQVMTAGDIYTIAGNGLSFSGDGRKAVDAEFGIREYFGQNPPLVTGIATAGNGNYAIYDDAEVRLAATASGTFFGQVMTEGNIYAVAGDGHSGYSGDGGMGTAAAAQTSGGVAFDQSGNLVIADSDNHVVRVLAGSSGTFYGQAMTVGHIYTVAGDGNDGYSGNAGPALLAELGNPVAVAVDSAGNLVIADLANLSGTGLIRVVAATTGTFYGQAMTAGSIYLVAGTLASHTDSADGAPATAADLDDPAGVAADPAGNLIISESGGNVIRVAAASSGTFFGVSMQAGDIYTIAKTDGPLGIAVDHAGNVLFGAGPKVLAVAETSGTFYGQSMTAGSTYRIAGTRQSGFSGDGRQATAARLARPAAFAVEPDGAVLIADVAVGRIRQISP